MKRTLILIRHAKSDWSDPLGSDFDRPLNERGKRDAPLMGNRLYQLGIVPGLIISSTAKRAAKTAKALAATNNYEAGRIQWVPALYHCVPQVFSDTIDSLKDPASTIFMVAHNPGITAYLNSLSHHFHTDNMPTCCIAGISATAYNWQDFGTADKDIFLFEYPRQHYDRR